MTTQIIHLCWVCGKPVDVATCKTDEYGEAVHETCYIVRLALEREQFVTGLRSIRTR